MHDSCIKCFNDVVGKYVPSRTVQSDSLKSENWLFLLIMSTCLHMFSYVVSLLCCVQYLYDGPRKLVYMFSYVVLCVQYLCDGRVHSCTCFHFLCYVFSICVTDVYTRVHVFLRCVMCSVFVWRTCTLVYICFCTLCCVFVARLMTVTLWTWTTFQSLNLNSRCHFEFLVCSWISPCLSSFRGLISQ